MLSPEIQEAYIAILREELVPAMGCTEPIAIAYGAAKAGKSWAVCRTKSWWRPAGTSLKRQKRGGAKHRRTQGH